MQNKAKLLTITEAAEILRVSLDTLRRWEKKGIINPQRTKGGVRRYSLMDLKIAKLNKRKIRFFRLPSLLGKSYSLWRNNAKVIALTSLVWILGIVIVHTMKPSFLQPTNPQQQILSASIKKEVSLQLSSELVNNQMGMLKAFVLPDQQLSASGNIKNNFEVSSGSDLLIGQPADKLNIKYADTPAQYYLLHKIENNIPLANEFATGITTRNPILKLNVSKMGNDWYTIFQ